MKKRAEHNYLHEGILEKEVSTPNGKYILRLVPSANSDFSKSFNLEIRHLDVGFLEGMLMQDKKLWKDACHDYYFEDKDYKHIEFRDTTPHEIGYNSTNGHFYVHFHQEVISQAKGEVPNLPRTKHFPVPKITTFKNLINYFQYIFSKKIR